MDNEDYEYGNEKGHSRTFKNGTRKSFRDKIRFQNKSNDESETNGEVVKQKWSGKYQNESEEEEEENTTNNNNTNNNNEESEEEEENRDFREKKKNKRELRKEKKELKNRDK